MVKHVLVSFIKIVPCSSMPFRILGCFGFFKGSGKNRENKVVHEVSDENPLSEPNFN